MLLICKKHNPIINLLVLFLTTTFSYAQIIPDSISKKLTNELQVLSNKQCEDNIYIKTSKDIYETGEDLWFKGYVLNAQHLTPSSKSEIIFVQLINNKTNKPVWEEKYEIENGFVNGHIFIQDTLSIGDYTLAAYSSYSYYRNQQEFYAFKTIKVVKNIQSLVKIKPEKRIKDTLIQFNVFPEGGRWISGIKSRLAFKAINTKGDPIDISGVLYENNQPVLNFKSIHNGMGSFYFTPNSTHSYHIQLNNRNKKYKLPKIEQKGMSLEIFRITDEAIFVKVAKSNDIPNDYGYVRVQIRGFVYILSKTFIKNETLIKIPTKDCPQGIAEVTLFNKDLNPVAERLVYVNLNQKLYIKSDLNKKKYYTREKVSLKIKVTNSKGTPIIAHLGLSVYDNLYQNKNNFKNIETHYHLRSLLKGKISNPTYYFNQNNEYRKRDLELLLLTQGWRAYSWNSTKLKELPEKKTIISDTYKGVIQLKRNLRKTSETGNKVAKVFSADTLKGSEFILSDSLGRFTLNSNHLKIGENAYFYVKSLAPDTPRHTMKIDDDFFKNINDNRHKLTNNNLLLCSEERDVSDFFNLHPSLRRVKLNEVVLKTKKTNVFRDKYLGTLDSLAKLNFSDDFVCNKSILNCPYNHRHSKGPPIEGKTYSVIEVLGVDKDGHEYIKPVKDVVYKYPKLSEAYLLDKYNLIMLKGYYGKKEFYTPFYNDENINDSFPDYRNTLYWKSDIITDENGEANIEFYTSDINTKFIGVIEGVSGTGLLGTDSFQFYVAKKRD